ncbi:MAG TPA: nucleotide exchange factor GrpE [Roseiflexaceae bacterium]|nr:nucleotide exchange factor GrpE [Roseiflexaceae bacterium]
MSDDLKVTPQDGQEPAADQAPAAPSTPTIEELQARIAQLEKELAEYKDSYLRAAADYRNFKRRTDQERADLIRSASAGLLLKLLPVMDDLERAMQSVTPEVEQSAWYGGFKLIPQKLQTILESEGVRPIEALGQDFDPNKHEAVIYEAADGQEGKVIAELQRGYTLRDKVLRPTMVKVGQG